MYIHDRSQAEDKIVKDAYKAWIAQPEVFNLPVRAAHERKRKRERERASEIVVPRSFYQSLSAQLPGRTYVAVMKRIPRLLANEQQAEPEDVDRSQEWPRKADSWVDSKLWPGAAAEGWSVHVNHRKTGGVRYVWGNTRDSSRYSNRREVIELHRAEVRLAATHAEQAYRELLGKAAQIERGGKGKAPETYGPQPARESARWAGRLSMRASLGAGESSRSQEQCRIKCEDGKEQSSDHHKDAQGSAPQRASGRANLRPTNLRPMPAAPEGAPAFNQQERSGARAAVDSSTGKEAMPAVDIAVAERCYNPVSSNVARLAQRNGLIGRAISKFFPVLARSFAGTVQHYHCATDTFTVLYEDGDSEVMLYSDLLSFLVPEAPAAVPLKARRRRIGSANSRSSEGTNSRSFEGTHDCPPPVLKGHGGGQKVNKGGGGSSSSEDNGGEQEGGPSSAGTENRSSTGGGDGGQPARKGRRVGGYARSRALQPPPPAPPGSLLTEWEGWPLVHSSVAAPSNTGFQGVSLQITRPNDAKPYLVSMNHGGKKRFKIGSFITALEGAVAYSKFIGKEAALAEIARVKEQNERYRYPYMYVSLYKYPYMYIYKYICMYIYI